MFISLYVVCLLFLFECMEQLREMRHVILLGNVMHAYVKLLSELTGIWTKYDIHKHNILALCLVFVWLFVCVVFLYVI